MGHIKTLSDSIAMCAEGMISFAFHRNNNEREEGVSC